MKKIIIALLIFTVILIIAQPIINKDTDPTLNIEQIENTEGIKRVSVENQNENLNLKILVENAISENEARDKVEKMMKQIDVEDREISFSVLYEHGYLIGQGTLDVDNGEVQWD